MILSYQHEDGVANGPLNGTQHQGGKGEALLLFFDTNDMIPQSDFLIDLLLAFTKCSLN